MGQAGTAEGLHMKTTAAGTGKERSLECCYQRCQFVYIKGQVTEAEGGTSV